VAGDLDFAISSDVNNLAFATGLEYREEKGKETPDPLREAGIVRGNKITRTEGQFDVVDVFGELHVPLLEQLNLDVAVRFGDYSSVGKTSNWTIGIDAPLNESWRLRGAVATAVRAPNVSDLFAGGTATSAFVTDPCNGINATTAGNIAQNCRSVAAIAERIRTEGAFNLTQVERQNTQGLLSGSINVKEEQADTLTAGLVFTPEAIDNLQISLDYYDIKIDDAIDKTDRTVILNRCYSVAQSAFDPNCGGLVRRDGRTGAALDVNAASGNENIIETQGIDFESSYETILGQGELYISAAANFLQKYEITGIASGDTQQLDGEVLFPKIRVNFSASYTLADWNLYWQLRYWDNTKDRNNNKIMTDELNTVPSRVYNDLRLSYQLSSQVNSHIGVNNLFDVMPPLLTANHKYQQAGTLTNGTAFDLTGRAFYAGIHVTF
jgi:outer membrane receptor protein involved in Fe transport